jgi:hypothetical protein
LSEIIEHPWVGVIMDIAQERYDLEEVKSPSQKWYGDGFRDDLIDLDSQPVLKYVIDASRQRWRSDKTSWSRLMTVIFNNAVTSQNPAMLRANLLELGAVVTAWIEDLDLREKSGK